VTSDVRAASVLSTRADRSAVWPVCACQAHLFGVWTPPAPLECRHRRPHVPTRTHTSRRQRSPLATEARSAELPWSPKQGLPPLTYLQGPGTAAQQPGCVVTRHTAHMCTFLGGEGNVRDLCATGEVVREWTGDATMDEDAVESTGLDTRLVVRLHERFEREPS